MSIEDRLKHVSTWIVCFVCLVLVIHKMFRMCNGLFVCVKIYSQTCPWGHLYSAVTCIKMSPFSWTVIENCIWIEVLFRDHLSYKATFFRCSKGDLLMHVWLYIDTQKKRGSPTENPVYFGIIWWARSNCYCIKKIVVLELYQRHFMFRKFRPLFSNFPF